MYLTCLKNSTKKVIKVISQRHLILAETVEDISYYLGLLKLTADSGDISLTNHLQQGKKNAVRTSETKTHIYFAVYERIHIKEDL